MRDLSARGTRLVEDILPGPTGSEPVSAARLSDTEIFFVADDGVHGRELWALPVACVQSPEGSSSSRGLWRLGTAGRPL